MTFTLTYDSNNYSKDSVLTSIEKNIKDYLKALAFKDNFIFYAQVISSILKSDGVVNCSNVKINNDTIDIVIADNEVAVLGSVVDG